MLLSLLILSVITAGGFALTYLVERDEPILWRLSAGSVIGFALFGTVGFVLAMLFGLTGPTVTAALALTALPVLLVMKRDRRKTLEHDWAKAKGKMNGATPAKAWRFAYYAAFGIFFVFYFDKAMIVNAGGIFTGGSNNLGDLPFHLGAIFSFADGANFPPENPNYAGAKFSYPFISDLITAAFLKLGVEVRDAMFVQNVAWAFSLLVVLEHFVRRLTGDRLAGRLAPVLLFFSGGLGFIWFLGDYFSQPGGFFEYLNHLPKDYTIGDEFRWGNSLTTLFLTQRSILLGMPITIIVLGILWKIFSFEPVGNPGVVKLEHAVRPKLSFSMISISPALIVVGLLAGTLLLIHLHSLFVLFVVSVFILLIHLDRIRMIEMAVFAVCVALVAVPELLFSMSGSATRATEFIAFHFGFDSRELNVAWFWIKNTGLFIPLVVFGIYLGLAQRNRVSDKKVKRKNSEQVPAETGTENVRNLLLFYIPFVFLFILANVAKLAPWEWDNIKVLIYWFVGSLPFVAVALAWMWRRASSMKVVMVLCVAVLTASGALDVWRTLSGQINYEVFSADAVIVANRAKASTPPGALFLNAPTYNSAVVLTGRSSLMRYTGHLSSHGIDFREREEDLKKIYRGTPDAAELMEKYGIEYVMISPEEKGSLGPNEAYFARFPVIAQSGQYRVHKVR